MSHILSVTKLVTFVTLIDTLGHDNPRSEGAIPKRLGDRVTPHDRGL